MVTFLIVVLPIAAPSLFNYPLPLSQYFLRRFSSESKKSFVEIEKDALAKLASYHWPGNVRELANTIERAVVLGNGPMLAIQDLPGRIAGAEERNSSNEFSYREAMEARRRELVLKALAQSHGNRVAAAKALGLHEKYLLKLIKELQIL